MDAMEEVSNGDLLCLNVGGTLFHTRRQTLVGDGDCSLLASMFSGRWESGLTRDTAGNVFLDEAPETFKALLALLRKRDSGAGPVAQTLEGVSAPLLALADKFFAARNVLATPHCLREYDNAPQSVRGDYTSTASRAAGARWRAVSENSRRELGWSCGPTGCSAIFL